MPYPVTRRANRGATALMAEVIQYGPVNVTRATAHRLAMEATGDKRAADRFAFAPPAIVVPEGCEPWSYADAAELFNRRAA